jgi:biopolymer transport protein ExbD
MDFTRTKRVSSGIDLAPLIDCVFLLLVFFMLSSSFLQPAIPLSLPQIPATERPLPHHIALSMTADGNLFINEQMVASDQLGPALIRLAAGNLETPILFRGDRAVSYEQFLQTVTIAREAGFHKLSLQHQAEPVATP